MVGFFIVKNIFLVYSVCIYLGNTFCITLQPRLFVINLEKEEHQLFITDLLSLCDMEDSELATASCYKSVTNFSSLRQSALRVLAACYYLEDTKEQIFQVRM